MKILEIQPRSPGSAVERKSKGQIRVSSPCYRSVCARHVMKGALEGVRRERERRIFQIKIVSFSSIFCPPDCLFWKLIQKEENVIVLSS